MDLVIRQMGKTIYQFQYKKINKCADCPCCNLNCSTDDYYCGITQHDIDYKDVTKIPTWCPLKENDQTK